MNRFEVRPLRSYAFLLGAGASVQAGIPTGGQLTWEFKNVLYCNHHKLGTNKFNDLEAGETRAAIQAFLDSQKIIPPTGESEYSFYFERCFPSSEDRKYFIQSRVNGIQPSFGHKCLGQMIVSGKVDHVFTTNFDELVEAGVKSINAGHSFVVISSEVGASLNSLTTPYPKVVKLHGDYRYDKLQNTPSELQGLDSNLLQNVFQTSRTHGLIVAGYSGSDKSVMDALQLAAAEKNAFPHGLVWCLKHGQEPNEVVKKIVHQANEKNGHSGFLYIDSFDELAYALYTKSNGKHEEIEKASSVLVTKNKAFELNPPASTVEPVILNAVQLSEFPTTAYMVPNVEKRWKELKPSAANRSVVFSLYKRKLYMWGDLKNIQLFLNDTGLINQFTLVDLPKQFLGRDNSFYLGMLYDAVLSNFVGRGFKRYRKNGVYDPKQFLKVQGRNAYQSLEIQIGETDQEIWLRLFPTVFIDSKDENRGPIVNSYLSQRYNAQFAEAVKGWRHLLVGDSPLKFSAGADFKFTLASTFAFGGHKSSDKIRYFPKMNRYEEPKIEFNHADRSKTSVHPLKGLTEFGPYQNSYLNQANPVRLAVISPTSHFARIRGHLDSLNSSAHVQNVKELYLPDFPGFYKVFGKPLDIPTSTTGSRVVVLDDKSVSSKSYIEFYEILKKAIDQLAVEKSNFDVLVIFIPKEWVTFREHKTDEVYFDLHDSAKLYCAKLGIKVQFIESKSLEYSDQVRVRWWLAQGLYAKGVGIPWQMTPTLPNTAFIGLGYALRGGNTLLAASQIFDETGRGLRVLLQPIRKHIFIGDNPFMSKDDARRLVTNLRESYFQSGINSRLDRIVIHKTTFFTNDEIQGITQALDGIKNIELIQIQEETLWRGIRWNCRAKDGIWVNVDNQKPYAPFPLQRGTALQMDNSSMLLWTDGSVMHPELRQPKWNYYQSSRGIPSPLLIKRFHGTDPADVVLGDILKLTKMNWNSGQLYKRLPVTLEFSKTLSKMAKQSESLLNGQYYDFRYFI